MIKAASVKNLRNKHFKNCPLSSLSVSEQSLPEERALAVRLSYAFFSPMQAVSLVASIYHMLDETVLGRTGAGS